MGFAMMHQEISQHRLASQKLYQTSPSSPQEVVRHLGAMQAQDYAMAKWAIGVRCGPIMMNAELDGLICNGKMKDKQITYALLEERVTKPKNKLSREEALAKLAKRYFESHGPATLLDFSWWSGFSLSTCKLVISSIELELNSVVVDNQKYWFGTNFTDVHYLYESIHFLPAFDEILIAYKTREVSILPEHKLKAFTQNGIFKPIILENGKVVGTWKKNIKKNHTKIETQFFI